MKQIIFFVSLLLMVAGCKKDDNKQKEILLSEVSSNGALSVKISYSGDNRLLRYDTYSGGVMNAYLTFSYDGDGHVESISSFISPGDIPAVRILVECDTQGKIISVANYDLLGPTPNTPISHATYSYNPDGRLGKVDRRDEDEELLTQTNLSYFPDGNLKEVRTYEESSNQLWLSGKTIYSVPNGFQSVGAQKLQQLLGPDVAANLLSESIQSYRYDQNGGTLNQRSTMMSGREFNEDGSLKKQVQTATSIKPPQAATVSNMSYEYIRQ